MSGMAPENGRRGRPSQHAITRSGLRMCQKDGLIKALGGDQWDVAPQSAKSQWRRVPMPPKDPTCACKYHATGRGRRCKHVAAVEQLLSI